jgi:hypothetical protein
LWRIDIREELIEGLFIMGKMEGNLWNMVDDNVLNGDERLELNKVKGRMIYQVLEGFEGWKSSKCH